MAKFWERKPELLLLQNIPKPMHQVNPRSVLGDRWWNAERAAAYASTDYHCEVCGRHKSKCPKGQLEGHEVYDTSYTKGTLTYIRTTPLCAICHQYIHDGRLQMMLSQGLISSDRYCSVIKWGDAILAEAGISKQTHSQRAMAIANLISTNSVAKWEDWVLVIDTTAYRTKVLNQYRDKISKSTSAYIGRGSPWGNPYVIGDDGMTRDEVIDLYEKNTLPTIDVMPLFGKDLVCFCSPKRCHGDSIMNRLYGILKFGPKYRSQKEWEANFNI